MTKILSSITEALIFQPFSFIFGKDNPFAATHKETGFLHALTPGLLGAQTMGRNDNLNTQSNLAPEFSKSSALLPQPNKLKHDHFT